MKKRALVEAFKFEVFEHKGPGRKSGGQINMWQQFRGQHTRAGYLRPDCCEMTLARALGPDQGHDPVRPVRPPFDQIECGKIWRTLQEVLAGEAYGVIKRQQKLARGHRTVHASQSASSPV